MKTLIQSTIHTQRQYFESGQTLSYEFRLEQLKTFKKMLQNNESAIMDALEKDLAKHPFESYTAELYLIYAEINHTIKHLKKWMKPKNVKTPISSFGARSKTIKQPKGITLIMSPWNYPLMLTLEPVVGSIAAGNCTVIKPSSYSVHTSQVIEEIISNTFDSKYIAVFQGNREINTYLLEEKFDHIFFTGSVKVGKIVMTAAAKNLTPVTLELGGKNPCIIDKTADLKKTAKRIVWGKASNSGQTCVAPDYLLVHESVKDELIQELIKAKEEFFGTDMLASTSYGKIIRQTAYDHLVSLLDGQTIIHGGNKDPRNHKIELTFLDNPHLDSKVMAGEIFGPILPIIPIKDMKEARTIINRYEKPLSLYLFSKDKKQIKEVIETYQYGGGCINDVVMHVANGNLPFGGFGESGMGSYHSHYSFNTFSHTKGIVIENFLIDINIRYAPYNGKLKFIKKLLR